MILDRKYDACICFSRDLQLHPVEFDFRTSVGETRGRLLKRTS